MSGLCIMLPFVKIETSEEKINDYSKHEVNTMDRDEDSPLVISDITVDANPIDYDTEDDFDEEDDYPFEPKCPIVEKQDTVFSLDIETSFKNGPCSPENCSCSPDKCSCSPEKCSCSHEGCSTNEQELNVDSVIGSSFIARFCNRISKCFTRAQ